MDKFQPLAACLVFGACMLTVETVAAASPPEYLCERDWQELSKEYGSTSPANYEGLLRAWKALESKCGTSALYRARLGLTYFFLDRPNDAKAAVSSVAAADRQQEPMVEAVELLADAALLRQPTQAELHAFELRVRSFSEKNPSFIAGLSLLADILSQIGRNDLAIELYEKALSGMQPSPRAAGILRNLTVSYSDVARHKDAYEAAQKALALDRGLLNDPNFVCAVAKAQAAAGEAKDGLNSLTLIAAKKPEVKESPRFKAALAFVVDRMNAEKK